MTQREKDLQAADRATARFAIACAGMHRTAQITLGANKDSADERYNRVVDAANKFAGGDK